jgi:LuxR family maltose regulon positive regulatory protein
VDAAQVLVLDDYHLVTSPAVHQALQFLLEHQPSLMHLIISTRQDPPLPLHQLRARGQVTGIGERDLRFTAEEAAAFLNQTMALRLSSEAVAALEARTEGWITGLQLAALALQEGRGDVQSFVSACTGDARYVMDYLVAEVLQRQSEAVREFLRQTAILDRLTAPLCNALTGIENSQEILEQLEGANLFLLPLDHRRQWYHYHRLFAEVLRTTLGQEEQMLLHEKAAHWYESHGLMSQAIQHSLAYASVFEDWDGAEQLIRLAAEEMLYSGSLLTVQGWLDALPDECVRARGELATYKGWVLALTGEVDLAEEYADAAEARLRLAESPGADLGKVLTLRSFIAVFGRQDYEAAIDLAADALGMMKEDQARWRVMALWAMAESQERTTDITESIATLRKARRDGQQPGRRHKNGSSSTGHWRSMSHASCSRPWTFPQT